MLSIHIFARIIKSWKNFIITRVSWIIDLFIILSCQLWFMNGDWKCEIKKKTNLCDIYLTNDFSFFYIFLLQITANYSLTFVVKVANDSQTKRTVFHLDRHGQQYQYQMWRRRFVEGNENTFFVAGRIRKSVAFFFAETHHQTIYPFKANVWFWIIIIFFLFFACM